MFNSRYGHNNCLDLTCNKIASLYNGEKEVFDQIEESLRAEYIEKLNGTSEK